MIRKHALAATMAIIGTATAASALQQSMSFGENWSYGGSDGPDAWSTVAPACGAGMQSPIVISGTEPAVMHRLETLYNVTPVATQNAANTVQQNYEQGSLLRVGPKVFILKEFHFHTPAEHQVLEQTFPMEIQFTHQALNGEMAIVSVLVREGRANQAAEELLPNLPIEPGQGINLPNVKINARDFMPQEKDYYRYMGFLSHPPCTPGVNWYVLKTPIEFSADQIKLIQGIVGTNNRPVQPRDNRIILDAQTQ
ncbi:MULTISPECIES: carbonic anhydrase [Kordiimonas]|jgi:carbonic anhydrase|uniref:carbonic anhydrase n=1 Tax=Kordiimonas TaxID=288021 RepID=UPI00257C3D32|nr:carbonic anhydrase family protein [Kordiimonas sp. UBA4487]